MYVCYHFVEGEDYDAVNYTFSFPNASTKQRVKLRPRDDNLVEGDEAYNLTIVFVSEHDRVILGRNRNATILIYDDDGK